MDELKEDIRCDIAGDVKTIVIETMKLLLLLLKEVGNARLGESD